jgi:hypothetical protein
MVAVVSRHASEGRVAWRPSRADMRRKAGWYGGRREPTCVGRPGGMAAVVSRHAEPEGGLTVASGDPDVCRESPWEAGGLMLPRAPMGRFRAVSRPRGPPNRDAPASTGSRPADDRPRLPSNQCPNVPMSGDTMLFPVSGSAEAGRRSAPPEELYPPELTARVSPMGGIVARGRGNGNGFQRARCGFGGAVVCGVEAQPRRRNHDACIGRRNVVARLRLANHGTPDGIHSVGDFLPAERKGRQRGQGYPGTPYYLLVDPERMRR